MSLAKDKVRIIKPQKGFQEEFVRSNTDLTIGGGAVGVGKTFGATLAMAQWSLLENFRALFIRKNIGELLKGGGLVDKASQIFNVKNNKESRKEGKKMRTSGEPRLDFPSGARIDFTHVDNEDPKVLLERVKGWEYDCVYLDEGTSYKWETFTLIFTRVRGEANIGSKIRITTNPNRSHWLRKVIDWYIGSDGFLIPERNGVVRYFYLDGESVDDFVTGSSKMEVYQKCKASIDALMIDTKGGVDLTYRNFIKSMVYYGGTLADNQELLAKNPDYIGNIAASGKSLAMQLLLGNWNVDPNDNTEIPIPATVARKVVENDVQANGDKWITVDLADYGTDNLVSLVWDGFHIIDMMILNKSTPRENAMRVVNVASKHNIANSHIIYDATSGRYFADYVPDAIAFMSNWSPRGLYGRNFMRLKDECYGRFVYMMNKGLISMSDKVANMPYTHETKSRSKDGKRNISTISLSLEFIEECGVVQFTDLRSGKKQLLTKKEMNQKLGKSRSMDVLDPCAMRMLPVLGYMYGEELVNTSCDTGLSDDEESPFGIMNNSNSMFSRGAFGVSY